MYPTRRSLVTMIVIMLTLIACGGQADMAEPQQAAEAERQVTAAEEVVEEEMSESVAVEGEPVEVTRVVSEVVVQPMATMAAAAAAPAAAPPAALQPPSRPRRCRRITSSVITG